TMHSYATVLLAVTLPLGLATNGWAGAPTEQLRAYTDQILKVLENPGLSLPEKRAQVRKVASEAFDTTETAQRVLGLHWKERTPPEQEEVTKPFANLLEPTHTSPTDEDGGGRPHHLREAITA